MDACLYWYSPRNQCHFSGLPWIPTLPAKWPNDNNDNNDSAMWRLSFKTLGTVWKDSVTKNRGWEGGVHFCFCYFCLFVCFLLGGGQLMITGVTFTLFTHLQPHPPYHLLIQTPPTPWVPPHHHHNPSPPFLLRPLFLPCCSVAMATKKCGNTSVLQRKRVKESEGGDSGCEEEEKDGRKERKGGGQKISGWTHI